MSESVVTELTVEYTRKQLTKPASRSQHQQWFMKRTKQARRKSPTRMVRYVTSMSDTVSLINSCGRNKGKEGVLRRELVHTSPTRLHLSVLCGLLLPGRVVEQRKDPSLWRSLSSVNHELFK